MKKGQGKRNGVLPQWGGKPMSIQEIMAYCMQKPGAYQDCPFGPEPVCIRVEKRIFAEIFLTRPWITLKCEPVQGLAWRETFPEQVRRGWHCPPVQQPYHNTVTLDGVISKELLQMMMDHSYARAVKSLSKTAQRRLQKDE